MNVSFDSKGHGIIPDHQVRATIDDAIAGKDAVMEYTIDLIRTEK